MKINIWFTGLLTTAFIVLKLLGKIGWSWLWVLSPAWIPVAVFLSVITAALMLTILARCIMGRRLTLKG